MKYLLIMIYLSGDGVPAPVNVGVYPDFVTCRTLGQTAVAEIQDQVAAGGGSGEGARFNCLLTPDSVLAVMEGKE